MGFRQVTRTEPTFEEGVLPENYDWVGVGKRYFSHNDPDGTRADKARMLFYQIMAGGKWLVKHSSEPSYKLCLAWGTHGSTPSIILQPTFSSMLIKYKWVSIQDIRPADEGN